MPLVNKPSEMGNRLVHISSPKALEVLSSWFIANLTDFRTDEGCGSVLVSTLNLEEGVLEARENIS